MLTRQEIRADVAARLAAANTVAGARVYASRNVPLTAEKIPAIIVYTRSESGVSIAEGGHPQFRNTLRLVVEAYVSAKQEEDLDDAIDALCEQIETALLKDPRFVDQFEQIAGFETEIEFGTQGKTFFAAARMTFDLVYVSAYPPTIPADHDLKTINIRVDTIDPANPGPGPDGRDEAVADIVVPT